MWNQWQVWYFSQMQKMVIVERLGISHICENIRYCQFLFHNTFRTFGISWGCCMCSRILHTMFGIGLLLLVILGSQDPRLLKNTINETGWWIWSRAMSLMISVKQAVLDFPVTVPLILTFDGFLADKSINGSVAPTQIPPWYDMLEVIKCLKAFLFCWAFWWHKMLI